MKKSIMQSTVKVEGAYGVEIGDYAIISSRGYVAQKPIPEGWNLEVNQTDGKVPVDEELLEEAERINAVGASLSEAKKDYVRREGDPDGGGNNEDTNPTWLLDELEEPVDQNSAPSGRTTVLSTIKLDGKLGWEYFPGHYLFEDGKSYSPHNPLPKGEAEPADEEFTVDLYRYIDARSNAEKLGFIAEAEELGIEGYID